MLSPMADDFTGVPRDEWETARDDMRMLRNLLLLAVLLMVLLVMTLIDKGVLTGWSDLVRLGHPHE